MKNVEKNQSRPLNETIKTLVMVLAMKYTTLMLALSCFANCIGQRALPPFRHCNTRPDLCFEMGTGLLFMFK